MGVSYVNNINQQYVVNVYKGIIWTIPHYFVKKFHNVKFRTVQDVTLTIHINVKYVHNKGMSSHRLNLNV